MFFEGFLGDKEEPDSKKTIVQKTHGLFHLAPAHERYEEINPNIRTILLLRNPYE